MAANPARGDNGGPYEINAEWVASETGVACRPNFGGAGAAAPGPAPSHMPACGVAGKADEDSALKKYGDTIDRDGDPVRIS